MKKTIDVHGPMRQWAINKFFASSSLSFSPFLFSYMRAASFLTQTGCKIFDLSIHRQTHVCVCVCACVNAQKTSFLSFHRKMIWKNLFSYKNFWFLNFFLSCRHSECHRSVAAKNNTHYYILCSLMDWCEQKSISVIPFHRLIVTSSTQKQPLLAGFKNIAIYRSRHVSPFRFYSAHLFKCT